MEFLEGLEGLAEALAGLAEALANLVERLAGLVEVSAGLVGPLANLVEALTGLVEVSASLVEALANLVGFSENLVETLEKLALERSKIRLGVAKQQFLFWSYAISITQLLEGFQCLLPAGFQVYDRPWIIDTQADTARLQDGCGCKPRLMDETGWHFGEFRNPFAYIVPLRVEAFALQDWIENTKIRRGIGPATGHPLPTQGVIRQIRIHQGVPKPTRPFQPVEA